MNNRLTQAFKDYENMLLESAKYSGNKKAKVRKFSASMLGSEPLENYLKFMHGSSDTEQFEANTLGSIYQLGVDEAADQHVNQHGDSDNPKYISAIRYSVTLSNGWEVSGEIDQLDTEHRVIFDNKLTQTTTLKEIIKQGRSHSYALQLGVYKWLIEQDEIKVYGKVSEPEYLTAIPLVDKKFSYFVDTKFNQLNMMPIETYSTADIEQMLLDATNLLDEYIKIEEQPPECRNKFPFKPKSQSMRNMKCIHYCDFAQHCKYVKKQNPRAKIQELLDL